VAARLSNWGYFKEIKAAKKVHWKSLLSSATSYSIWTVKKIATGSAPPYFLNLRGTSTPREMNDVLLSYNFPPYYGPPLPLVLPPFCDYPELRKQDVSVALSKCLPTSAPGPENIPYTVWKTVHHTSPSILVSLLGPLFRFGHYPSSLKKANGVVLDWSGKEFYDTPASFRIIVLLQTVSKILERIIASSLAPVAR